MSSADRNIINQQPNYSNMITRRQSINIRNGSHIINNRNTINERCIFCHELGHDVVGCNDDRLIDFQIECREKKRIFNRHNRLYAPHYFRDWVFDKFMDNNRLVRGYAMKKIRSITENSDVFNVVHGIVLFEYPTDNFRTINYFQHIGNNNNGNSGNSGNSGNNGNNSDVINLSAVFYTLDLFDEIVRQYNENSTQKIKTTIENLNADETNVKYECSICYEKQEKKHFVKLDCQHEFCNECIKNIMKTQTNLCCALCRKETTQLVCYTEDVKCKFYTF